MRSLPARTILLVEDDELFRDQLARALRARNFEVEVAHDFEAARQSVSATPPHFALVDLRLPGKSGLEVISEISATSPATRTFLLTGSTDAVVVEEARQRGAVGCLRKPIDADEIVAVLNGSGTLG